MTTGEVVVVFIDIAMNADLRRLGDMAGKIAAEGLSKRERARLLRRHALHRKYAEAVELYACTDMPLNKIAEACGASMGALGNYLRRYWRELVLLRHHLDVDEGKAHEVKLLQAGKQSVQAHEKYKNAVEACDTMAYIDLNVSQVARKFGVEGTPLANFMRVHYPEILTRREEVRRKLGINDNVWHGARRECVEQYADAVELYRDTDLTIPAVAEKCGVSESGLSQHLRFYHKDVLAGKRKERKEATGRKREYGQLLGNGQKYKPSPETEKKYAEALSLYKTTSLTMKEIVKRTAVSAEGFRWYVHKWHKDLVLERLGVSGEIDERTDLRRARNKMKTTAAKYEKAIESLKRNPRQLSKVAAEFGFNPEVFRMYIHRHEPELAKAHGMKQLANGKLVSRSSDERYAEAIRLYATTCRGLRAIASELGLVYKSVYGFLHRNYPDVIAAHNQLVQKQAK